MPRCDMCQNKAAVYTGPTGTDYCEDCCPVPPHERNPNRMIPIRITTPDQDACHKCGKPWVIKTNGVPWCRECGMGPGGPIAKKPAATAEPDHTGSKYLRLIHSTTSPAPTAIVVDCYDMIDALNITCPAVQHAFKKIAYTGVRGKATYEQDLTEAIDALKRAIQLHKART
jgi:hypothetical protein